MLSHFLLLLLVLIFASTQPQLVNSHEEKGEWSCESPSDARVHAEFRPGMVTLDGHADDWEYIDGFEFPLLLAVDPDAENEYEGGKMIVKVHIIKMSISFIICVYLLCVCVLSVLICV